MNFDTLTSIFETYGWPGIVVLILAGAGVYFINKKDNSINNNIAKGFKELSTDISEQNKTLITAITESNKETQSRLFELVNESLKIHTTQVAEDHTRSMARRIEISEEIGRHLWDLMNIYNAQRTMVIEFHNSKENMNGLSFVWYDVQYEKQQRDVPSISATARNLQASNLLPVINRVNATEGNIVLYKPADIESIYEQSTVLYSQLKEANITNVIFCGLYSQDNKLIGLVVLEYSGNHVFHEDLINYYDIKAKSAAISQLLQFK